MSIAPEGAVGNPVAKEKLLKEAAVTTKRRSR